MQQPEGLRGVVQLQYLTAVVRACAGTDVVLAGELLQAARHFLGESVLISDANCAQQLRCDGTCLRSSNKVHQHCLLLLPRGLAPVVPQQSQSKHPTITLEVAHVHVV